MTIALIVAADQDDTIGRGGELPWHLPADLRRFKHLTMGHALVAGRVTQDSIVSRLGTALPDRVTVVVTRDPQRRDTETVAHAHSVAHALRMATALTADVFVIGGAEVYAAALASVARIHLTRVHDRVGGDRRLPAGWLDGFRLTAREPQDGYAFETYERG